MNPGAAWHYKYLLTSPDPYRNQMMERPLFIKDQVISSDFYIVQMIEHPLFVKHQVISSVPYIA